MSWNLTLSLLEEWILPLPSETLKEVRRRINQELKARKEMLEKEKIGNESA